MGSKTKATKAPYESNSTSYVENSPDIDAAREQAGVNINDIMAPALQAQYDRARQKAETRTNSAYNQAIPAQLRMAQQNMQERDLTGDQGMALAQGAYDQNQTAFARRMALADLTAKRQQTGSGYNTQVTQTPSLWGSIIGGGLGLASSFIKPRF